MARAYHSLRHLSCGSRPLRREESPFHAVGSIESAYAKKGDEIASRREKEQRAVRHRRRCHLAAIRREDPRMGWSSTAAARSGRRGRVEKGSDSPPVGKRRWCEQERESGRGREGENGLKSSGQAGFDRSIFIPWPDESAREQRLQTRVRIDPSFLCVLARGTVRSRHCSARRRTRPAGGSGAQPEKRDSHVAVHCDKRAGVCGRSLLTVVQPIQEWRAKRLSSITRRRRSSANGKALGSSYGTPRLDSSWGAQALVGVSSRHPEFPDSHIVQPNTLRRVKSN